MTGYKIPKKHLHQTFYLYKNSDELVDLEDISATGSISNVTYPQDTYYTHNGNPLSQNSYILPTQWFAKTHSLSNYKINDTPMELPRKGESFFISSNENPTFTLSGPNTYKLRLDKSQYPYKLNVYKSASGYLDHLAIQETSLAEVRFDLQSTYNIKGTQIIVAYCGAGGKGGTATGGWTWGAGGGGAGSQIAIVDLMSNTYQTDTRDIYIGLSSSSKGAFSYICREGGDGVYAENGHAANGTTPGQGGGAGWANDIRDGTWDELEELIISDGRHYLGGREFSLASSCKGADGGKGKIQTDIWGNASQWETNGSSASGLIMDLHNSYFTFNFSAKGGLAYGAGGGGASCLGKGGDCEDKSGNTNNAGYGGGGGGQNNTGDTPWNGGPGLAKIWFPTH